MKGVIMKRTKLLMLAVIFALTAFVWQSAFAGVLLDKPVTSNINFPKVGKPAVDLSTLKKSYSVKNFKLGGTYDVGNPSSYEFGGQGGVTLESLGADPLKTSYIALGTPKRNSKGEIINAIVINPYYSGDSSAYYFFWYDHGGGRAFSKNPTIGKGLLFDTDKYYVVMVDSLGLWGTSKPSEGLGTKFPKYSYYDMVQLNYRLLKDHLNVGKVVLATGVSMGATQTYVWGALHPEYVERIMPIGGTAGGVDNVSKWLFSLATAGLESDPVWQKYVNKPGNYYGLPKEQHPNQGVAFLWSVLAHTGFSFDLTSSMTAEQVAPKVFQWDVPLEKLSWCAGKAKAYDAVDLWYRNMKWSDYDLFPHLSKIKSDTLVIHVKNDQWLNYSLAEKTAGMIENAQIISFESPFAHYAVFQAPELFEDKISAFLEGKTNAGKKKTVKKSKKKGGGSFSK
jgi:homoserine O-acetyltransferase